MKNYFINSIETSYCSKTIPIILNFIQLCKNCNLIPLPPYRSNKQLDVILCKACYLSHYKNFDCNILPSITDIKLLDQIVISCKFFSKGCNEEFSINSLENRFLHENKCIVGNQQLAPNCTVSLLKKQHKSTKIRC